jgi:limonene-1,2-epoxide hydrolase
MSDPSAAAHTPQATATAAPSPGADTVPPPASQRMQRLFDDYGEAWASHDPDAIAAFHAEDGVFHLHAGAEEVRGRETIRETFAGFLAQFPDLEFAERQKMIEDWGWVVRWTMSGTLAVSFDTGSGVAERGGRIAIDAVDLITVEDGLLTAKHTYLDWAAALRQLGLA